MTDFIQKLIEEEQQIEAVKYIYAFDMIDKFPPVPILKDYLSNSSKHNVEQLSKKKRKSIGEQVYDHKCNLSCTIIIYCGISCKNLLSLLADSGH